MRHPLPLLPPTHVSLLTLLQRIKRLLIEIKAKRLPFKSITGETMPNYIYKSICTHI